MTDIESLAKEAAGNHLKFRDFVWYDRPDDYERWTVVYVQNRDSGLLDQSNAEAIQKEMEPFLGKDCVAERHNHWACGWVDGYAIRVYRKGKITKAFQKWCEIQERLADYPLLDDEDYSHREYESALEGIREVGRRFVKDGAGDLEEDVYHWLSDSREYVRELENRDDRGAYPSGESVRAALEDLGIIGDEYRTHWWAVRCPTCGLLAGLGDYEGASAECPPHLPIQEYSTELIAKEPDGGPLCTGTGSIGLVEEVETKL